MNVMITLINSFGKEQKIENVRRLKCMQVQFDFQQTLTLEYWIF